MLQAGALISGSGHLARCVSQCINSFLETSSERLLTYFTNLRCLCKNMKSGSTRCSDSLNRERELCAGGSGQAARLARLLFLAGLASRLRNFNLIVSDLLCWRLVAWDRGFLNRLFYVFVTHRDDHTPTRTKRDALAETAREAELPRVPDVRP
jgi:hypothetical protein